ncbi:Uncharacterised protein [Mycobacteroides abscessus subsp. abscessus]|nr:Uncharacterised protein [Mycobacteroides abscessus subsp. abscessus]
MRGDGRDPEAPTPIPGAGSMPTRGVGHDPEAPTPISGAGSMPEHTVGRDTMREYLSTSA